jgi:uncharacterized protein
MVDHIALLILLGALSGFVSGVTGFGSGLILMGTLVAVMPVAQATVIAAVLAIALAAVNLWSVRTHIPWGELLPTMASGVPCVALGVYLLGRLDDTILRFGVVGIILAGCAVVVWSPQRRYEARLLPLYTGAISGVFNGALGTGGPPLVLHALLRGWEKQASKAYMSALFLLLGMFRMTLLVTSGVATWQPVSSGLLMLMPVVGAWYLGKCVFQRVSTIAFRYAGLGLLLAMAANLISDLV